jgi:Trypsin-co-occurring domain 2
MLITDDRVFSDIKGHKRRFTDRFQGRYIDRKIETYQENTMQIRLSEAIKQIREELRSAVVEGRGQEVIFQPKTVELEFGVTFEAEASATGGFKILALLDLSTEAKASRSSVHTVKLTLEPLDHDLKPLLVRSTDDTKR